MAACRQRICADLHLHTTASDGAMRPLEMVEAASARGVNLIAITDHDTVAGVAEAMSAGSTVGMTVLPAIELSTGAGREIHLLGYGLHPEEEGLDAFLQTQLDRRQERMVAMLDRLRSIGIEIDLASIRQRNDRFLGRVDLAQALVSHGHASSVKEAFARYLKPGKPGYVSRARLGVQEGIAALRSFGAVTVLAHPGRSGLDAQALDALLPCWMEAGLAGLEAYHASHDEAARRSFDRIARKHALLVTGGSDSHGRPEGPDIGDHLRGWRTMQGDAEALLSRMGRSWNGL